MIPPDRLARLRVWAARSHPDHPHWAAHQYMGGCPWCRGDRDVDLTEGGAHVTALELLDEVDRLMAWLASAEAVMLAGIENRDGWRNEAGLLVAALYGETYKST